MDDKFFWLAPSMGFFTGLGGSIYWALRKGASTLDTKTMINNVGESAVTKPTAIVYSKADNILLACKALGISTAIVASITGIGVIMFMRTFNIKSSEDLHMLLRNGKRKTDDEINRELHEFIDTIRSYDQNNS